MLHKIGFVSRRVGLSERRIREYEKAGLVTPQRQPRTGDRVFTEDDIRQLERFVMLVREDGFTISSLRALLRYGACWILTGCGMEDRCPSIREPRVPCYESAACTVRWGAARPCESCPIYRVGRSSNGPLFQAPGCRATRYRDGTSTPQAADGRKSAAKDD